MRDQLYSGKKRLSGLVLRSRVLRYAVAHKADTEPLDLFIRRKGGINACAARFSRRMGRGAAWTAGSARQISAVDSR